MAKRLLILEDGTIFEGQAFGADVDVTGEIVFNTGMTGYQESITDQSYNGQILSFTYPLVGNYCVNRDDYESIKPTTKGVVVSEASRIEHLQDQLRATVLPTNNIEQVSTKTAYPAPGVGKNIVLVDFGLKHSILREFSKRDCNVTVVPHDITAEEILHLNPDGVMLSNGPGNPEDVPYALDMIRGIQGKIPIFGICMGHQLFSLANGAKAYKMKFGHRGFNHAVREIATGRVDFTSQNHGYAIDRESLPDCLMVTHEEINDKSVEGVRHRDFPAFSVQFHPDAAPGPHDASYLFDEFLELIDAFQAEKARS